MFEEFIGKEVKCCFKDFNNNKIARGTLVEANNGLIKISGQLGILIINEKQIVKMSLRQ